MSGFKDFADGNVLTAAEIDGYLMRQTVMRFPNTADLLANLPSGIRENGMLAWTDTATNFPNGCLWQFDGTNWRPIWSRKANTTLPFTAGGTQVTVGNASVTSEFWMSGGAVNLNWHFSIGSSTNMQTGNLSLALPIASEAAFKVLGVAGFYDFSGPGPLYPRSAWADTTTSVVFSDNAGVRWSTTSPTGFGVNDRLSVNLHYAPSTSVYL